MHKNPILRHHLRCPSSTTHHIDGRTGFFPCHHPSPASRLSLSHLAPAAVQSEIRAMTTECDRIGASICSGRLRHPVPAPVQEAAIQASTTATTFTPLDALRASATPSLPSSRATTATYDPETEVSSPPDHGRTPRAAMALLNPGDEVLVFEPSTVTVSTLQSCA